MLINLRSAISYVFDSTSIVPLEIMGQEFAVAESKNEEMIVGSLSICDSAFILIEGTFKIKSVDLVLHNSRITDNMESHIKSFNALTSKELAKFDLPDHGIWISIHQTSVKISCEGKLEIFADLSELQCSIFRYESQKEETTDHPLPRDWLLKSLKSLCEISLSSCRLNLSLLLPQSASSSSCLTNTSVGNKSYMENVSLTTDSESLTSQSSFVQEIGTASNILAAGLSCWLHVNMVLGVIYMGRRSVKSILVGAHDSNKLLSSLSLGGEVQAISWGIQVVFV